MSDAKPDIWMPWYIADYAMATQHLTNLEDLAYRRLIEACWLRRNTLPDDDDQLARLSKLSLKQWRKVRPAVATFFNIEVDGWHQDRVGRELENAQAKIDARRKGAQITNENRWGNAKESPSNSIDGRQTASLESIRGTPNGEGVSNDINEAAVAERHLSDTLSGRPSPSPSPSPSADSGQWPAREGKKEAFKQGVASGYPSENTTHSRTDAKADRAAEKGVAWPNPFGPNGYDDEPKALGDAADAIASQWRGKWPHGWQPNPQHQRFANREGRDFDWLYDQAADFPDWCAAQGIDPPDNPDALFTTFLKKQLEWENAQ